MTKIAVIDKDGGPESTVWAYWLLECKTVLSIVLLKFVGNSRECYHTHAFNSISWVLKGQLTEEILGKPKYTKIYKPSIIPIITKRDTFHKVSSKGTSWIISFRGPWKKIWEEFTYKEGFYMLTHGRKRYYHD